MELLSFQGFEVLRRMRWFIENIQKIFDKFLFEKVQWKNLFFFVWSSSEFELFERKFPSVSRSFLNKSHHWWVTNESRTKWIGFVLYCLLANEIEGHTVWPEYDDILTERNSFEFMRIFIRSIIIFRSNCILHFKFFNFMSEGKMAETQKKADSYFPPRESDNRTPISVITIPLRFTRWIVRGPDSGGLASEYSEEK